MTMKEFQVSSEGSSVKVVLDDGSLVLGGSSFSPTSASTDLRRTVPFWILTFAFLVVMVIGTFFAIAVHSLVLSPIIALGSISVCIFIYLATRQREMVLFVECPGRDLELTGDPEVLRALHYELAKVVLRSKGSKSAEQGLSDRTDREVTGRAGSTRSSEVLSDRETEALRKDLGKGIVKRTGIVARICPQCYGSDLYLEAGMWGGAIYHCKDCDYIGPFIIERELTVK